MKSMNRIQLIGWLGKDPAIKTDRYGKTFVRLMIATNYFHEGIKHTDWHYVYCWRNTHIAHAQSYLLKGSHVMIEGRVAYRLAHIGNGLVCRYTEIHAETLIDLDR